MKKLRIDKFVFWCSTEIEEYRVATLFTKEPGTIEWLRSEVKPGDVFWDVGANIGLYSIFAASLGAKVFAFEPHIPNAASLLRNVEANGMQDRITVLNVALDSKNGLVPFHYFSLAPGASGSQLHQPRDEYGNTFEPKLTALQAVSTGFGATIEKPDLLKIDTDGNEFAVIGGMGTPLSARSVQIEMHPQHDKLICEMMTARGFGEPHRHYTANGQERLKQGAEPLSIPHNAVFNRKAV